MKIIALFLVHTLLFAQAGSQPNATWNHAGIRPSRSQTLAARCLWAERGWQSVAMGLAENAGRNATTLAREELEEHARLHGWVGEPGSDISWLVTESSRCPPAALAALSKIERLRLSAPRAAAFRMFARALAENQHTDRAIAILDELRFSSALGPQSAQPLRLRDTATWEAALILESAGQWSTALEYFELLGSTKRWDDLAIDRHRAHCLSELNRIGDLEALVFENLMLDPSCAILECLIGAWSRTESPKGRLQLIEGASRSIRDVTARARIRVEINDRWNAAQRHLHVLGMPPRYAISELSDLLDGSEHHRDVQRMMQEIGIEAVDFILEFAGNLPAGKLQLFHELYSVLAETGLPQLELAFETVNELSPGFPYLEIWMTARALRNDLEVQSTDR